MTMRVALHARVSSDRQEREGTIGSQLEVLQQRARAEGWQVVMTCPDDGYSGTRLDRPGLDQVRDAAMLHAIDALVVLCPDRLARNYVHQMIVLEELGCFGVRVVFCEGGIADDPQGRLMAQIQAAVAEFEQTKIVERNRRGKLFRARRGGHRLRGGPLRLSQGAGIRRSANELDQAVWDEVVRHLQNPDLIAQASIDRLSVDAPQDNQVMASQLAELKQQQRRLLDAYQAGAIMLPALQARQRPLLDRIAELELHQTTVSSRALSHADPAARITAFAHETSNRLQAMTFAQRQQLLRTILGEGGCHPGSRRALLQDPFAANSAAKRTVTATRGRR
jgi:DNA invertase Pin-like site-specific DNA recombinase